MELEESQSEQNKCPMCAENIKLQAKVCHFCGAEFKVVQKGYCRDCQAVVELTERDTCPMCDGGEVIDRHFESRLVSSSTAPATVSALVTSQAPGLKTVADAGELKVGIGVGYFTWLPWGLEQLALITLFWAGSLGFLTRFLMRFGSYYSPDDPFIMASSSTAYAAVPIAVPILVFLLVLFFPRKLFPRPLGLKVFKLSKHYKQERKKLGFKVILKKKGLVWKWIISMPLWAALIAVLISNYSEINDNHLSIRPLFYVLAISCAVGFIAHLLLWPFSKREVVQIDRDGNIYKRGEEQSS